MIYLFACHPVHSSVNRHSSFDQLHQSLIRITAERSLVTLLQFMGSWLLLTYFTNALWMLRCSSDGQKGTVTEAALSGIRCIALPASPWYLSFHRTNCWIQKLDYFNSIYFRYSVTEKKMRWHTSIFDDERSGNNNTFAISSLLKATFVKKVVLVFY